MLQGLVDLRRGSAAAARAPRLRGVAGRGLAAGPRRSETCSRQLLLQVLNPPRPGSDERSLHRRALAAAGSARAFGGREPRRRPRHGCSSSTKSPSGTAASDAVIPVGLPSPG